MPNTAVRIATIAAAVTGFALILSAGIFLDLTGRQVAWLLGGWLLLSVALEVATIPFPGKGDRGEGQA